VKGFPETFATAKVLAHETHLPDKILTVQDLTCSLFINRH